MYDRRKRNRFLERNDVLLRTAMNKYQGPGIAAYTHDLSSGGARIVTSKNFAVGTILRIRVNLSGSDQFISLDGEVKWQKAANGNDHYEIGVEFLHLTSPDILKLLQHLYGRNEGIPSTVA